MIRSLVFSLFFLGALSAKAQLTNIQLAQQAGIQELVEQFISTNKSRSYVEGWRIQILSSTDRQTVESTLQTFRYQYPNIQADWVHNKPYYKVQAGAFSSKLEAVHLLHLIQQDYPSAYLIQDSRIRPQELLNTS